MFRCHKIQLKLYGRLQSFPIRHSVYVFVISPEDHQNLSYCYHILIAFITFDKWGPIISWSFYCLFLFLRTLERIFPERILWTEDTTAKEEYASRFKVLFIHFLFIYASSSCTFELFGEVLVYSFFFLFLNFVFRHTNLFLINLLFDIYYFCLSSCVNRIYHFCLCVHKPSCVHRWSEQYVWEWLKQGMIAHYRSG